MAYVWLYDETLLSRLQKSILFFSIFSASRGVLCSCNREEPRIFATSSAYALLASSPLVSS
jgi:hypothetical protein